MGQGFPYKRAFGNGNKESSLDLSNKESSTWLPWINGQGIQYRSALGNGKKKPIHVWFGWWEQGIQYISVLERGTRNQFKAALDITDKESSTSLQVSTSPLQVSTTPLQVSTTPLQVSTTPLRSALNNEERNPLILVCLE